MIALGLTGQGAVVIISTTHCDAISAGWRIAISRFRRELSARWPSTFPAVGGTQVNGVLMPELMWILSETWMSAFALREEDRRQSTPV